MKQLMIVALMLALSGCVGGWSYYKAGASKQQSAQDNYECRQAALQPYVVGYGGTKTYSGVIVGGTEPDQQAWMMCLQGRGYTIYSAEQIEKLRERSDIPTMAAQGDAGAQFNLGWMYQSGQGVPQDFAQARAWYEKAAVQGNAVAQVGLGVLNAKGLGVTQDYAQARAWYEKAAAQGNAQAQNNLGWMYQNGQGVLQDYAQARQWYEKAAAQGNELAQDNIGWLYREGKSVPQDYAQARAWYEKAAAQGYADAQASLGVLYANGQGGPQDLVQAHLWLSLAAAHGNKDAAKERDNVAMKMSPAQLAEAQQLAQQCQARQFKGC